VRADDLDLPRLVDDATARLVGGATPARPVEQLRARAVTLRRWRSTRRAVLAAACVGATAVVLAHAGAGRSVEVVSGTPGPGTAVLGTPVPGSGATLPGPPLASFVPRMPIVAVGPDAVCSFRSGYALTSAERISQIPARLLALPDPALGGRPDSVSGGWVACGPHSPSAGPGNPTGTATATGVPEVVRHAPSHAFIESHSAAAGGYSLVVLDPGSLGVPTGRGISSVQVDGSPAWWSGENRTLQWRDANGVWYLLKTWAAAQPDTAIRLAQSVHPVPGDDERWAVYLTINQGYHGTPPALEAHAGSSPGAGSS
jgi:hypothetical protein